MASAAWKLPLDSLQLVSNTSPKETKVVDKPAKKRAKKKTKRHSCKITLKTKVIVRRLPPNLPEEIFMNSVKPWISEETVDYSLYVPGKLSKSKATESIFSRAYFHLKSMEGVVAFHQGFDGHVFMDSRGNENRAVVEFALYQRIPKEHKITDARQGTIDEDQDYLNFLESLKAEEKNQSELQNEPADGLSQIERLENRIAMVTAKTLAAEQANKPKTTPLLEHLRAQKAAQAANRAKSVAKKNTRKRPEQATPKKNDPPKTIQQPQSQKQPEQKQNGATSNTDGKKKRERNRKKKDVDGVKKEMYANNNSGTSTPTSTASAKQPRPPRESKASKPKEPRRQVEGSNPKPKGQNNNKKSNGEENNENKSKQQPPVVKILERQSPASNNSKQG